VDGKITSTLTEARGWVGPFRLVIEGPGETQPTSRKLPQPFDVIGRDPIMEVETEGLMPGVAGSRRAGFRAAGGLVSSRKGRPGEWRL
jgi:hypothetical protein